MPGNGHLRALAIGGNRNVLGIWWKFPRVTVPHKMCRAVTDQRLRGSNSCSLESEIYSQVRDWSRSAMAIKPQPDWVWSTLTGWGGVFFTQNLPISLSVSCKNAFIL